MLTRLPLPAAFGGVFEFATAASANLREKDDHWNHAVGGFLGGAILGVRSMHISASTLGLTKTDHRTLFALQQAGACRSSSAMAP